MPEYTLNRNHLHRSTQGFTIKFEKGRPVHVPPACEREVVAFGAERVDGDNPDVLAPENVDDPTPVGQDREAILFAAFEQIVAVNDSKDFGAAGTPSIKAVERLVKFGIDKKELLEVWHAFRASKDEAQ